MTSTEPDLPELRFVRPLPGFGELTRFVLVSLDDDGSEGLLSELRSLERDDVRFLVAPPGPLFPDYEVELDDDTVADLGLTDADDAIVLVVLTLGADGGAPTANLLAPVIVNARTRAAAQVILSGTDWPVRAVVA
ncbi:MAG: flagellar assembly protein FliW [Kineosporiaceae bacterium]